MSRKLPSIDVPYRRIKYLATIRKIPHDLWNGMRSSYCFHRKPKNNIERHIIPFRKVLDGILHVLRTVCQWKMLPKERTWF
jgi:hypothetical protein